MSDAKHVRELVSGRQRVPLGTTPRTTIFGSSAVPLLDLRDEPGDQVEVLPGPPLDDDIERVSSASALVFRGLGFIDRWSPGYGFGDGPSRIGTGHFRMLTGQNLFLDANSWVLIFDQITDTKLTFDFFVLNPDILVAMSFEFQKQPVIVTLEMDGHAVDFDLGGPQSGVEVFFVPQGRFTSISLICSRAKNPRPTVPTRIFSITARQSFFRPPVGQNHLLSEG